MPSQTELKCLEAAFETHFKGKTPKIIEAEQKKRFHTTVNDAFQRRGVVFVKKHLVRDTVNEYFDWLGYELRNISPESPYAHFAYVRVE